MLALNLTTGEYVEYKNFVEFREYMSYLFFIKSNNKSEWTITDNIMGIQPHLESQIKQKYTEHKRDLSIVPIVECPYNANAFLKCKY